MERIASEANFKERLNLRKTCLTQISMLYRPAFTMEVVKIKSELPWHHFIKLLSRKYCIVNFFGKKKKGGGVTIATM